MKDRTYIKDLRDHVDAQVTLFGWVSKARATGKVSFITLRDGSGLCQCVLEKNDVTAAFYDEAKKCPQEAAIRIRGTIFAEDRAVGGVEMRDVTEFSVVGNSGEYPITPKPHGTDFLMKNRHLWFRSQRPWIVLRIRATIVDAIRSFFNDRDFILIDTPIFAPAAGEGAQNLFEVDYFDEKVYLAQTGQLYVEAACMAHDKVYCFGPTFRAEKSKTRRHLTEFWMVEPEIAFADLDDVIELAEDFVCAIVRRVLKDHRADLETLGRSIDVLENAVKPFNRITHAEAAEILRGPKATELLQTDLTTKTARVEEIKAALSETEAKLSGGGLKAWQQDKLTAEVNNLREEMGELEVEIENIPHHIELARNFDDGGDLGGSNETIISRLYDTPTFVTHYPRDCKAFYMKQNADDPTRVNNVDLLASEGFGEIIGGSQREENYDVLLKRINEEGLSQSDYEWYLDLRRYGSVPHGGFGLGLERTVAWICGLKHIRETSAYPRMMGKIYP